MFSPSNHVSFKSPPPQIRTKVPPTHSLLPHKLCITLALVFDIGNSNYMYMQLFTLFIFRTVMSKCDKLSIFFFSSVSNPVPIQFQCTRSWSDLSGTFQFQLNWSIPNSMYLHNAISKFHVLLSFTSPRAHDETKDEAEVIFEV